MNLTFRNGYPFPYPTDASDERKEDFGDACQGVSLVLNNVTCMEWKHTLMVEFKDSQSMKEAQALTGWNRPGPLSEAGLWILEATVSPEDGYGHPAIVVKKPYDEFTHTAFCGFILSEA